LSCCLKVTKCLDDVGLSAEKDILSKKLSGGQKRKLSLAMAIIGDPRVHTQRDINADKLVFYGEEILNLSLIMALYKCFEVCSVN